MNNNPFEPNDFGNDNQGQNNNQQQPNQNPFNSNFNNGTNDFNNGYPNGNQNGYPNGNQNGYYNGYQGQPTQPQPGHNLALASLICGIISFLCCGTPLGIAAIICSVSAKKRGNTETINTAGLVCGIVGLVLSIISGFVSMLFVPAVMESIREGLNEVSTFIFFK